MEKIILRQLSSLQLYQVPVALRMTLLEDGLCLLNFWIFEIQNFCLPKLMFVLLEKRLYLKWTQTLRTRLLAESLLS